MRDALAAVPPAGYRWWYVDGLADDGRRGFTAIFLYGSVFSPWRWRSAGTAAGDHLGVHVALYEGEREVAWTMAHYGGAALAADDDQLRLGGSTLRYLASGAVEGEIDERTAPIFWSRLGLGGALRGRFHLEPTAAGMAEPVELGRSSAGERHHWQVRAPIGRIAVEFQRPAFRFVGRGYHDGNWGDGRLERAFTRWSWARFHQADASRILYAVEGRDGTRRGNIVEAQPGQVTRAQHGLPARFAATEHTGWGLRTPRGFTIDHASASQATVVRWLDRTPFYARYVARHDGVEGVGEYLDLDRYQDPGVQFLLRWRGRRPR